MIVQFQYMWSYVPNGVQITQLVHHLLEKQLVVLSVVQSFHGLYSYFL